MADAMDSKSISRKGVGVQVPASAPTRAREADELSRALVSVLLHDLANTTQYLSTLSSLMSDGPALNAGLLGGLSETTSEVDELGFVLGLVAHAAGADVLLERARRDGLDALLVFVKRALRSERRDLRLDAATRSRVRIDTPDRGRDCISACSGPATRANVRPTRG